MVETPQKIQQAGHNQQQNSNESMGSNARLDHSDQKLSEASPDNYLRIQNIPNFCNKPQEYREVDEEDIGNGIIANNNQIDINQNLHPFNSKNFMDQRKQLSKSNYTKTEEYKPFEIKQKIEYQNQDAKAKITYCTFNQDFSCIALGTEKNGFQIYQANPLTKVYQSKPKEDDFTEIETMQVVCVEMQFTSNILALVQTTQEQAEEDAVSKERFSQISNPKPQQASPSKIYEKGESEDRGSYVSGMALQKYCKEKEERRRRRRCKSSKRELIIWDTTRQEAIMTVKFFQKIISIKMNLKHIITLSKDKVYIHDLEGMAFVQKLDIQFHMSRVVLSPNISRQKSLIFYSDSTDFGVLKVYNIDKNKVVKGIMAHNTAILKIACDLEGTLVATNSANGDVIRLWSVDKGHKLATYRQRPFSELSSLSIGQSGLVTTFSETGYLETFTMPLEAIDYIQSSSQYSSQVAFSSFQESDFNESNDIFNKSSEIGQTTGEEVKTQKREKEVYTTFCSHFKQSLTDIFQSQKPAQSHAITFQGQNDNMKSHVICGASNDGRKIFAFDQATGQLVTILYMKGLQDEAGFQKPMIKYESIHEAPTQIVPRVARTTQVPQRINQYNSITENITQIN